MKTQGERTFQLESLTKHLKKTKTAARRRISERARPSKLLEGGIHLSGADATAWRVKKNAFTQMEENDKTTKNEGHKHTHVGMRTERF